MRKFFKNWFASGEPWIWLNAASVGISITAVVGILVLIAVKGFGHFWPADVELINYEDERFGNQVIFAELVESEQLAVEQYLESGGDPQWLTPGAETIERWLVKSGNRRHNPPDFRWFYTPQMKERELWPGVAVLERVEWGNAYGVPTRFLNGDTGELHELDSGGLEIVHERIARADEIRSEIDQLENGSLNRINYRLERLRLEERGLGLKGSTDTTRLEEIAQEVVTLRATYEIDESVLRALYTDIQKDILWIRTGSGDEIEVPLADILGIRMPNDLSGIGKLTSFVGSLWRFLVEDPREANTEGGIFPAIFGTVLMVLIMSVIVTPFGVIAAVYLREYAKQGPLVRIIRIAVNNLAGVPSIVYGVFGLGFFVYFLGGNIDRLFFPEALPAPTFGTPGLVWASLTLALLTVPVVIVSTEEGLTRIPRSLREGSLALGATKSETLFKIILPMASPAILTGVILAVARAAGEVAPLMLVGVVKLAPTLPLDGNFPYLHLDRKFMHMGFHIYDVGFQSPNVEAARPLVYATALLLVTIIVALNLTAITLRSRLERRYRGVES
ncbi:MAG: phosphate ABC transporter permease PstA [Pseudomonadales bacterium]|nr:phosphate ABC transporter permease PstA [Pseudomonadales bacterium]